VLPLGALLGLVILLMPSVTQWPVAVLVLAVAGGLAGMFVVPMNALLQHRGGALLSAGRSIAVQNFNENASVLLMLGTYALCTGLDLDLGWLLASFGTLVVALMGLITWRHRQLQRRSGSPGSPASLLPTACKDRP
jgi:hypothetical protein